MGYHTEHGMKKSILHSMASGSLIVPLAGFIAIRYLYPLPWHTFLLRSSPL